MTNQEFRDKAKNLGYETYQEFAQAAQPIPVTTVQGWWSAKPITPPARMALRLLADIDRLKNDTPRTSA